MEQQQNGDLFFLLDWLDPDVPGAHLLPQLLLCQGVRGGRRGQGCNSLATRFYMAMEGDWGV